MNKEVKGPFVSIVICSKGRRESLEVLVTTLMQITSLHLFEILVVEETDSPQALEGIIYVAHPIKNRGIPYARNLAMKYACDEIVVFVDDDCTISDSWLDSLLKPFAEDSVVGVQGGVTIPEVPNATSLPEVVGEGALHFDPHEPADMADKIDAVINAKIDGNDLRAKAKRQAAKFSWTITAKQTMEIFDALHP